MIRDGWFFGRKTRSFTLQWHLTNACPFQCRHCYDRTDRNPLSFAQAMGVLANFQDFCAKKRVEARISLSGGDPLVYPHFWELYEAIKKAKIRVSILGNPIPAEVIRRLTQLWRPMAYQVSLEGLREHNDSIRGEGHFDKAIDFLLSARAWGLNAHVMLTLTSANVDQVIPLGEELRGLTSKFTFNRLAQVGNGAGLDLPDREKFTEFLEKYLEASKANPILGLKENLLNVLRAKAGESPLPGCTGYGCGAAFNFVALLPDGEVHACRKFPSLLGNLHETSLISIYDSPKARTYRARPEGCRECRLQKQCGGCQAVAFGQGRNPLKDRDSFCFIDNTRP